MKPTEVPLVFLDMDGVLVSEPGVWQGYTLPKISQTGIGKRINRAAVMELNRITDATMASIVVSSTWRYLFPEFLDTWLRQAGMTGTIVGKTPDFRLEPRQGPTSENRGAEIAMWRAKNQHTGPYVVLDDADNAGEGHGGHFVQCRFYSGLTPALADKAISILNA